MRFFSLILISFLASLNCKVNRDCRNFDHSCNLLALLSYVPTLTSKFAYVTDSGNGVITTLKISSTGTLSHVTTTFLTGANAITTDLSGKYLFVVGSGLIQSYAIDRVSGALTPGASYAGVGAPGTIAVDPLGRFMIAATVGVGTAGCPIVGGTSIIANCAISPVTNVAHLTLRGDGQIMVGVNNAAGNFSSYTVTSTGAVTLLSGPVVANGTNVVSLAMSPTNGHVYGAFSTAGPNTVSTVVLNSDGTLGSVTSVLGNSMADVKAEALGRGVYFSNPSNNAVAGFVRNSDGTLAATPTLLASTGATAGKMATDPFGRNLYVLQSSPPVVYMFSFGTTGDLTSLGSVSAPTTGFGMAIATILDI